MSDDQELSEIEALEGSVASRPPKPIVDMSNEELTDWIQRVRNCTTQYQSLLAEARAGKDKKKDEGPPAEMFE